MHLYERCYNEPYTESWDCMTYILDGIVLLIVVLTVVLGYRRGFLKSLIQFVGCIAAFVLAFTLSAPVSNFVFDNFVANGLEKTLSETVVNNVDSAPAELLEGLPQPILAFLGNNAQLQTALDNLEGSAITTAESMVDTLMSVVVRPVMVWIIQFVAFILLFIVLSFVAKVLAKLVRPITKLPLLHQADGGLGAVLGLIKGAVFAIAFVSVVQLIAATASSDALITQDMINNSILVRWIAEINPIADFML